MLCRDAVERRDLRVLVLGAGGSAGSYLCEALLDDDPGVTIIGIAGRTSTPRFPVAGVTYCGPEALEGIKSTPPVLQQPIDLVFHLAANARVGESFGSPKPYLTGNAAITRKLFEALRLSSQKPRVLLASTPEVYGPVNSETLILEDALPCRPANPYAASKVSQEATALAYHQAYGIPVIVTRSGSYINPKRPDLVATAFARQIVAAERGDGVVVRHGNLASTRQWMDARDVVRGYLEIARSGVPGEVYHLAGNSIASVREILLSLLNLATTHVEPMQDPKLGRPTDVAKILLNDAKARGLGWAPEIPLAQSLEWLMNEVRRGS